MTEKERERVVELLRCAAELFRVGVVTDDSGFHTGGLGLARVFVGVSPATWRAAVEAWESVIDTMQSIADWDYAGWGYADVCLEAALRVEQGEYP